MYKSKSKMFKNILLIIIMDLPILWKGNINVSSFKSDICKLWWYCCDFVQYKLFHHQNRYSWGPWFHAEGSTKNIKNDPSDPKYGHWNSRKTHCKQEDCQRNRSRFHVDGRSVPIFVLYMKTAKSHSWRLLQ